MRTITLLFAAIVLGTAANAQTVATFDDLTLASDTAYVNYVGTGTDVGFHDGNAHFPCVYDSAYGWQGGFAYSDKVDSVHSGYGNEYSAKTATGYAGSANYAAVYCSDPVTFAFYTRVVLTGAAVNKPVAGFYVTNSTYAYNAIRDGYFTATAFDSGSWFLLTIKGYIGGALTTDSVNFYLADFRSPDSASRYILKTWEWVDLTSLGNADSLQFHLNSSDTAGGFGMNTPAFFCIDNFTTNAGSLGVQNTLPSYIAKVYPNPATTILYVDITDDAIQQLAIVDMAGNIISTTEAATTHMEINISSLPAGVYMLQLSGGGKTTTTKFVKQ
jgi:hypothetical protein